MKWANRPRVDRFILALHASAPLFGALGHRRVSCATGARLAGVAAAWLRAPPALTRRRRLLPRAPDRGDRPLVPLEEPDAEDLRSPPSAAQSSLLPWRW